MDRTPNPRSDQKRSTTIEKQRITEPFTGLAITVEVDSIAIGDAMKQTKLNEIYYADLRTVSVLFGIYQKKTLIAVGH